MTNIISWIDQGNMAHGCGMICAPATTFWGPFLLAEKKNTNKFYGHPPKKKKDFKTDDLVTLKTNLSSQNW